MDQKEFRYEYLADEQLVELAAQGDKSAEEFILTKYKNMVRSRAKSYFILGADREDLVQEGMIGLFKAVRDFDITKHASFLGFAEICIKRQMITAIKSASRQKHKPLNTYVSLSDPGTHEGETGRILETMESWDAVDPEELLLRRETTEAMEAEIAKKLSTLEQTVLTLYLSGMNYTEIAKKLDRTPKSIDNALQRIKRKLSGESSENTKNFGEK